ncbi:hypothetical protein JCM11251_001608 [Rhodosporidiobolus azoricus]
MLLPFVAATLAAGASSVLAVATPITPSALQSYNATTGAEWQYSNCQSDLAQGKRALSGTLNISNRTVEACLEACSKAGFPLCGVEYYGECWGGNALDASSTMQPESACELPCRDNTRQLCGGTGGSTSATMNLYKRINVPVAPVPTTPRVVRAYNSTNGAKWQYANCQSDLADGKRALGANLATANRTATACLEACSKTNYRLCGVEYYGECWAGDSLDQSSTPQNETACALPCADNSTQLCGGVGGATKAAMNLYRRTSPIETPAPPPPPANATKYTGDSNWAYKGCYTDDLLDDGRSLPNLLYTPGWTPQACLTAASSKGYSVAGLTSGGECWAGNAISVNAIKKDNSTCNWSCNDAKSFTCGSDKLVDVYTSTVPPKETVPTGQTTFGQWKYDACYSDNTGARSLPIQLNNPSGNIEGCLAACAGINATTCGLEWYGECFASKEGLKNGATQIDKSKCSTPCRSDSSQICGGSNALSIYKVIPTTTVFERYQFKSCENGIPGPILFTSGTLEQCLTACDNLKAPACSFAGRWCVANSGPAESTNNSNEQTCGLFKRYDRVVALKRRSVSLAKRETITTIDPVTRVVTSRTT